jgi:hypothetical protein
VGFHPHQRRCAVSFGSFGAFLNHRAEAIWLEIETETSFVVSPKHIESSTLKIALLIDPGLKFQKVFRSLFKCSVGYHGLIMGVLHARLMPLTGPW